MYPNYPEKHDEPAIITPEKEVARRRERGEEPDRDLPRAVILCYQSAFFERAIGEYAGPQFDELGGVYDLYPLVGDNDLGVAGEFGIGAPAAAGAVEHLLARGVEAVVSVGLSGGLTREVDRGDAVVADWAIRDEGLSHHYLASERTVAADPDLADGLAAVARDSGVPVHRGGTWTTDAIFRETVPELERYRAEGALTVEMEAAATFAVARYRGAAAGALFTPTDYLAADGWDAELVPDQSRLDALFGAAREGLRDHLDENQ
ncbi:MAG: phosphorylase, partial [Halobacteriaceae archaeon]